MVREDGPSNPNKDAPWVEKYRPRSLDDVAAHKEIVATIKRLLDANRLPHLLLYGPPGTGKTSTILALANQMYGTSRPHMVLELNASDDRGISIVRQEIQDFASSRVLFNKNQFKLVILDECDAMTKDAQFALRRIIEKYTRNTRFCLICNYVNKVIPALQSRCTRFRFKPLDHGFVKERLATIAQQEGVDMDEEGAEALITLGQGDMRRTLNIMQVGAAMNCPKLQQRILTSSQSTVMASDKITQESVYLSTGQPLPEDIEHCVQWLLNEPVAVAYQRVSELQVHKGYALADILQDLQAWVMRINMPTPVRIELVDAMADIEHRLAAGTSERLQLGALVGACTVAKEGIVTAVQ